MHKSEGIIIKDKSLLVLRSKGKDIFFASGGKLDQGETIEQALCRELYEEINIELKSTDFTYFTYILSRNIDSSRFFYYFLISSLKRAISLS